MPFSIQDIRHAHRSVNDRIPQTTVVRIPAVGVLLNADIDIPAEAKVVIAFAHGSGSSRHSSRNRHVAETLNGYGFATLLADLLTEEEEIIDLRTRHLRFDIPMLAGRLVDIAAWLQRESPTKHLKIGWFGASTGAGAALITAALHPDNIMAAVHLVGDRCAEGLQIVAIFPCNSLPAPWLALRAPRQPLFRSF